MLEHQGTQLMIFDTPEYPTINVLARLLVWLLVSREQLDVQPSYQTILKYKDLTNCAQTRSHPIDWDNSKYLYTTLFLAANEIRTRDFAYIHLIYILEGFDADNQRIFTRCVLQHLQRGSL